MNNIALIILNYNSSQLTKRLSKHLLEFGKGLHIIVVDNCSTDESYRILYDSFRNTPNVDVIKTESNRGYSAGNNFGFKYAINKYGVDTVGVMNPDVWIKDCSVIENLYEKLHHDEKYAVIGGATLNADGEFHNGAVGWNIPGNKELITNFLTNNGKLTSEPQFETIEKNLVKVDCVVGCFFLIKTSVLKQIGFLDENVFLYNEENLLGIKCKEHGLIEVVAIDQFYFHNHNYASLRTESLHAKFRRLNAMYQSRKYLCDKYYPRYLRFFLLAANIENHCLAILSYIKHRIWRNK